MNEVLDSKSASTNYVIRETLRLTTLAMIELGHAILDIEPEDLGYVVGAVMYEIAEFVIVEVGLGVITVASDGAAAPAAAAGTSAYIAGKSVSFVRIVQRLKGTKVIAKITPLVKQLNKFQSAIVTMTSLTYEKSLRPSFRVPSARNRLSTKTCHGRLRPLHLGR